MVMYAPHTLLVRRETETKDGYNRTSGVSSVWEELGPCRCDDNATDRIVDDTGEAFVPRYHIVSERFDVKAGDYVKALDGEETRGEGEVRRVIKTNYLNYMSIYV